MVDSPIDRTTIQRALRSWVIAATELDVDRVVWSPTNAPQRSRPWAWISIVGQPRSTAPAERERHAQPMLERVTVGSATPGVYSFRIYEGLETTGTLVAFTAGALDDVATIRGGLLAQVPAWPVSAVDPDDEDEASLLLAGEPERPRLHVEIVSGDLTTATVHDGIVDRWRQDKEITLRLQAETDDQAFEAHAGDLIDRAVAALNLELVRDSLRAAGLHFRSSNAPLDLSTVVDTAHVSRVAVDFIFALRSTVEEERAWLRTIAPTQVNTISVST